MDISQTGLTLIETFEGCELTAYKDVGGTYTIGYGHTRGVKKGDTITKTEANNLLKQDVKSAVDSVNKLVKVQLNQNQFDALVSFVFNCGSAAFKTSTLLELLNKGDYFGASNELLKWDHVKGVVVDGLLKRRIAERDLFNKAVPQPTATKYTSIVDYLKAHGQPSDFNSRRVLAQKHGIVPYSGRAEENIKLLEVLQGR